MREYPKLNEILDTLEVLRKNIHKEKLTPEGVVNMGLPYSDEEIELIDNYIRDIELFTTRAQQRKDFIIRNLF